MCRSEWHTPAARTCTSTSSGPGSGTATSLTWTRPSVTRAAFISPAEVERRRAGVATGSEDGTGTVVGEHPVAHDRPAVDEDVVDAPRAGVEPPGAAGQVETHAHLLGRHRLGIDDDDVGVPTRFEATR